MELTVIERAIVTALANAIAKRLASPWDRVRFRLLPLRAQRRLVQRIEVEGRSVGDVFKDVGA
jgi:hypothetical protein